MKNQKKPPPSPLREGECSDGKEKRNLGNKQIRKLVNGECSDGEKEECRDENSCLVGRTRRTGFG